MPRQTIMVPRTCETCNKPIFETEWRIADGRGRFCSQRCLWKSRAFTVRPVAERFWEKVDMTGDCWLWQGCYFKSTGYGAFSFKGKTRTAHTVAYELTHGPIADGVVIRHTCDIRPCVNPAHLIEGTQQDNVDDMHERGRAAHGAMLKASHLSDEDVTRMRLLHAQGALGKELAFIFGVSASNISHIVNRKTWKHLP